jgi:predicted Zn-dependent protease
VEKRGDNTVVDLRRMCGGPRDGALLRMSIANALLVDNDAQGAIEELQRALEFDANYSAAWKLLGKILAESNDTAGAADAYRQGIVAARARGDKQAEREMNVFLRRLVGRATPPSP